MTEQTLQINLLDPSKTQTEPRVFVHLTQPVEDGMDKTASVFDISQMVALANSGRTAHSYKKNECPAGINTDDGVNVRLDFWAWPSIYDLKYTLSSNIGNISSPQIVEEFVEFSVIFGMTDAVELDFMLRDITVKYWETNCYNTKGEQLFNQNLELDGLTTLRTDNILFGVARVRGTKVGALHTLTTTLVKSYPVRPENPIPEEGITDADLEKYWAYTDVQTWNGEPVSENDAVDMTGLSLTNLSITITAKWFDKGEEQKEIMRLNIPQCLKDLLAMCDGDPEKAIVGSTTICDLSDNPEHTTVYVSGCTGKVIEERTTDEDPDSWCE